MTTEKSSVAPMGAAASNRGAPKGNINRLRNGKRTRLNVGNLPACMHRAQRWAREYRAGLEAIVSQEKGEVSLADAHNIDAAAGAELHGGVCRWLLRERLDKMSVADVLSCSSGMLKARQERNRAVAALNLDRDTQADIIATLYQGNDHERQQ